MDAIDDVFGSMRTHTALYARIEGSAPWGVAFVRGRAARFGLVVRGRVWLTVESDSPIAMSAGDCYVIARGAQYALQDDPDSPTKFCFDALREHKHRVVHLGGARDGGGGGAAATVVTGWFMFDTVGAKPLFDCEGDDARRGNRLACEYCSRVARVVRGERLNVCGRPIANVLGIVDDKRCAVLCGKVGY